MAHGYSSASYKNWEICGSQSEDLEKLKISCFPCVTISVLEVKGKGFIIIYNLCWVVLLEGGEIYNSSLAL